LAPGSKICFNNSFGQGERFLDLKGEAYFDVIGNYEKPFIVNTGDARVKVTGTQFSVKAQKSSEEVAVHVNTGKVLFYNSDTPSPDAFRVGLGPGDVGIYLPKLKQLNKQQILSSP
jgi:transmembrane sensor